MLNIINHKGNANQNHDSSHYTCQDSHYQKNPNKQSTNTTVSVSKDVEKWEHLCTVDEDVKWFSCYGKQCGGSSKHSKQNYYVIQPFHFWIFIQRIEIRISKRQIFALLRSLPPYSQWLRGPVMHEQMKKMWYVHTHTHTHTHNGTLLNHRKKEILAYTTTLINLEDGPQAHAE